MAWARRIRKARVLWTRPQWSLSHSTTFIVSLLGPESHWPLPNTKGSDGSLLLGEGRVVEWSFLPLKDQKGRQKTVRANVAVFAR